MMKKHRLKKFKVRSGRRILGVIEQVGEHGYAWKATASYCSKDRGISGDLERATNNILKDCAGPTGTAEGFRRSFEVTVEES
jgi:hypothetical protein